jgi:tryptophan-rich sensory protein
LGTLIWALIAIWPYAKIITLANLPYLLWVMFATVLQITITVLNR